MALNNVPVPNQTLGASRDLINQNFSVINTAFSVNHVPYNDGSGQQGMHQFLQMPSATPTIATTSTQLGIYANTGPFSGNPELFFQRQSLAANSGYAFTEAQNTANGWTRLPSGILLKWGQQSIASGTSSGANAPVIFPTGAGIPVFNNVFQIILGQRYTASQTALGSSGIGIFSTSTTQFAITWNGSNLTGTTLTYLAIGN